MTGQDPTLLRVQALFLIQQKHSNPFYFTIFERCTWGQLNQGRTTVLRGHYRSICWCLRLGPCSSVIQSVGIYFKSPILRFACFSRPKHSGLNEANKLNNWNLRVLWKHQLCLWICLHGYLTVYMGIMLDRNVLQAIENQWTLYHQVNKSIRRIVMEVEFLNMSYHVYDGPNSLHFTWISSICPSEVTLWGTIKTLSFVISNCLCILLANQIMILNDKIFN